MEPHQETIWPELRFRDGNDLAGPCSCQLALIEGSGVDFDDLKLAIESQHGGIATRLQSVPVKVNASQMEWEGLVHVFALSGHPRAYKAYAWSVGIEGSDKRRYFAVLHSGRITCPQDAVLATMNTARNTS
jgi:hypothetical protein